mmetsp:Transcript_78428/g.114852  ORF Transcript_78428/g.114852 Transcript_78428/m.114852 type:complete len:254 (-) Transcript_78428:1438-2199(-)
MQSFASSLSWMPKYSRMMPPTLFDAASSSSPPSSSASAPSSSSDSSLPLLSLFSLLSEASESSSSSLESAIRAANPPRFVAGFFAKFSREPCREIGSGELGPDPDCDFALPTPPRFTGVPTQAHPSSSTLPLLLASFRSFLSFFSFSFSFSFSFFFFSASLSTLGFSVKRLSLSTSFFTASSVCGPAAALRGTQSLERRSLRSRSINLYRELRPSCAANCCILVKYPSIFSLLASSSNFPVLSSSFTSGWMFS